MLLWQHTIRGRMGYAPEVFRLGPAFTENNIQGEVKKCLLVTIYLAIVPLSLLFPFSFIYSCNNQRRRHCCHDHDHLYHLSSRLHHYDSLVT